jgi:hypothetical protein
VLSSLEGVAQLFLFLHKEPLQMGVLSSNLSKFSNRLGEHCVDLLLYLADQIATHSAVADICEEGVDTMDGDVSIHR